MKEVLLDLPSTLDEIYERTLIRIDQRLRKQAIVLLQWLAYAQSPPTLGELTEASIVDPTGDGSVQSDDRGGLQDTLEILAELITCGKAVESNHEDDDDDDDDISNAEGENESEDEIINNNNIYATWSGRRVGLRSRVRLAHFSVKEYLESKRILQSSAKDFFLEPGMSHEFLAQSCLAYIIHYSSSREKTSSTQDMLKFPLLRYAAQSWHYHSLNGLSGDITRETSLLQSEDAKRDWLIVHRPNMEWKHPFDHLDNVGSSLYYASFLGLARVVRALVKQGADVDAEGGTYGNALQAASFSGDEKVVAMLLERGADVNAQGGAYGNALQAASYWGYEKVVTMLLERGADVDAQGGAYGNALQAALSRGDEKVVTMLLERGADVNAQSGKFGNTLQAASFSGDEKVVAMLLERGADVTA